MRDDPNGLGESEVESTPNLWGADAVPREVLGVDYVYTAIGHPRRRYLCYTLYEDDEWPLRELSRRVAAWENDIPPAAVSDEQLNDVYIALYHAHIPKLVDMGVVAFDEDRRLLSTAHHTEEVLTALEGVGASFGAVREAGPRGTSR